MIKQYGCFKLSSVGPEILAFISHCSANFQPIMDCFIPKFKLKCEDPDNTKADRVNTVVFNLHQIKRRTFFGTPGSIVKELGKISPSANRIFGRLKRS